MSYMTDKAMIKNLRMQAESQAENNSYHGSYHKKEDMLPWLSADRIEELITETEAMKEHLRTLGAYPNE